MASGCPVSQYVHFLGLEPYGAERLEVLKGPSSVMYGGSGTGGILNYVSKLPTAHQFGESVACRAAASIATRANLTLAVPPTRKAPCCGA